jgi:hypothetical protein
MFNLTHGVEYPSKMGEECVVCMFYMFVYQTIFASSFAVWKIFTHFADVNSEGFIQWITKIMTFGL